MGMLTRAEIVSEGQLLAGRDDMATEAAKWLQRWLDSVAASWPWPQLLVENTVVPVSAGQTAVPVAAAVSGFGTLAAIGGVTQVRDNVWVYNPARTWRSRLRIKHTLGDPADQIGPTSDIGRPQFARVLSSGPFAWSLRLNPIPNEDIQLLIPVQVLGARLSSDTAIPWYPNDETMVQAVAFKVSEYHNGKDSPVTGAFQQQLAGLVSNDRIRYGSVSGINDTLPLDRNVFRRGS